MNMTVELKKRILTGIIGGAAFLCLIIFGGWIGIFLLATLLSMGMLFEFSQTTYNLTDRLEKKYLLLSWAWGLSLVHGFIPHSEFFLLITSFLTLFIYFLFSAKRHEGLHFSLHFKELMFSLFGLVYLVFILFLLPKLYEFPNGINWTLTFFFIVWAGDTGAYFAGKKYGKVKLYAKISPKKTVEGSLGGLVLGVIVTVLFKLLIFRRMPWAASVCIPVVVGVFAQLGDLCESFFKRAFDIKDSGTILPGHGGILDRFDGVVFSLPVMYICVRVFC